MGACLLLAAVLAEDEEVVVLAEAGAFEVLVPGERRGMRGVRSGVRRRARSSRSYIFTTSVYVLYACSARFSRSHSAASARLSGWRASQALRLWRRVIVE